ncbi:MAG: LON peptidase substrate-binding domain-containing protein [Anaerolineae bacterium]|nr:LON peptidase substrate-binding domain-containing protein [Anaerolineae bacterium]
MVELPLFPLNTVLFPGVPISLHIFEERYKEMVEMCLASHTPFGVVLSQDDEDAFGIPSEPSLTGTSAQITQVERLPDGRMNILAVGLERFQVVSLRYDRPYLMGTVEPFPIAGEDTFSAERASDSLRPWVERYLEILTLAADEEVDFETAQLPDDPLSLGYLAAALVQIPSEQKQKLLDTSEATTLLHRVRTIYTREVPLLQRMMDAEAAPMVGSFSLN